MNNAKKILAWAVAWCLYWIGHVVSKVMEIADWGWLYPAYNHLMRWSLRAQDWGGVASPWGYSDGREDEQ